MLQVEGDLGCLGREEKAPPMSACSSGSAHADGESLGSGGTDASSHMTSAVPGMSVADMRRCLAEVRTLLGQQSAAAPFDMQYVLSNGTAVWDFVHRVALGLHQKRSHNRRRAATTTTPAGTRVDDGDERSASRSGLA